MNVNDIVQERIQAARARHAANKRRRDELNAARAAGLTARHAAKLRHLSSVKPAAGSVTPPDTTPAQAVPDRYPLADVSTADPTDSIQPTDTTPKGPD